MTRRYGERDYDDEERYEEREYDASTRGGEETYGGPRDRGSDYGRHERGHSAGREYGAAGRDYSYARDYGYGREPGQRDYNTRDHAARDYGARDYDSREYGPREYRSHDSREYGLGPREYGRRVLEGGGYSSRGYEADDYRDERGRDYERERERERRRDPNEVRSFDTDYGRTTSRFYGRSGYEFGRDDYDRPNYGPEVTEYRGRRDAHDDRRDPRDRRDERGRGGRGWWDRAADEVLSWFGDEDAARRRRTEGGREIGNREREMASRAGAGLYRGRGPKNYRRPDDRIREEINDRLTDNDWLDASDIDVSVVSGEVTLSGTVDSRYSKRLAEDIAESVTGVAHVQNNLRVQNYQTGSPAAAPAPAGDPTVTTGDVTVASSDAPTMKEVIKNAVTGVTTTTPNIEGSAGADAPPEGTRASGAGGRG